MINWGKIFGYALAIFATQFFIGFLEGFFLPESAGGLLSVQGIASSTSSLLLCTAIFAHLAVNQVDRTLVHGALALLVQALAGAIFAMAIASWLVITRVEEVAVELLILLAALALGTCLGARLRDRHAVRGEV